MYDVFRSRYTFACPTRGEALVALSAFRRLVRLPGATHPAVYQVEFDCGCGETHVGLVADDDLDWAPLGLTAGTFLNLMTSRVDAVGDELAEVSARRIKAGEWPWSFFCYPEERPRPVFPSSFSLLAPGGKARRRRRALPRLLARLREPRLDGAHRPAVPQRRAVGVVEHVFAVDAEHTLEEFRAELHSAAFDYRRLALE